MEYLNQRKPILEVRCTESMRDKIANEYPDHAYTNPHQPEVLLDTIAIETDDALEALRKKLNIPSNEFDWRHKCLVASFILFY
jgi:preprotein translocase subunit SecA